MMVCALKIRDACMGPVGINVFPAKKDIHVKIMYA